MRPVAGVYASVALFVLLAGLEWEGSRSRWLRQLADGDEARRVEAIQGLVALLGPEVDAAIVAALSDASEDVRFEAALACESRALTACAAPLSEWLGSTDAEVRATAARALGRVGSDADVPALARVLGDARPQVRRAAAQGLGALGGAAAVHALVAALGDADPIVRERAALGLGAVAAEAGERGAASTALLARVRDEAPEVRATALDALGALGDPRAGAAASAALDDDVVEVRLAAMRALTRAPSVVAVPALVRASLDEDREGRAALAALARAPGDAALDAIVSALARPSVARSAEDALEARMLQSEASRAEVVRALARAIETAPGADPVARVAASASRLAAHVSTAGLEGALLGALRSGAGAPVLEALGRTGAEEALVPVLDGLASDAASTRAAALAGLEGLAAVRSLDGRVLDPLTLAMGRLDESEQARAVTVAGAVVSERASEWLARWIDEGARGARIAALRALRGRSGGVAISRVAPLLGDPDAEIRTRAAEVLAARASEDDVDETVARDLAAQLTSDAPRDRQAILLALGPMLRALPEGSAREVVRASIALSLDAEDPELADAAAIAVASSGDAALAREALTIAGGPARTARALRALAGTDLDQARAFGLAQLDAQDPEVVLAAYATLAEIGGSSESEAIAARAAGLRFPASAGAAFALARMARRGVARSAAGALATLAASHDPHVRANVAVAAARLGLARLDGGTTALDWLGEGAPPLVRSAAARWAFAAREGLDAARVDALLAACGADPLQPALARACSMPALGTETDDLDLIAVDANGRPMPGRLVAVRLADGSALVTYTDARARVHLAGAPVGSVSLDAPESAVLVP